MSDITDAHPVYELRQYKIVKGERERFMRLFDEAFVDSQEAVEVIAQAYAAQVAAAIK